MTSLGSHRRRQEYPANRAHPESVSVVRPSRQFSVVHESRLLPPVLHPDKRIQPTFLPYCGNTAAPANRHHRIFARSSGFAGTLRLPVAKNARRKLRQPVCRSICRFRRYAGYIPAIVPGQKPGRCESGTDCWRRAESQENRKTRQCLATLHLTPRSTSPDTTRRLHKLNPESTLHEIHGSPHGESAASGEKT